MATSTRSRSPSAYPDLTEINLNRLLARLQRTVLEDPSPQLRSSTYQRARVGANIEHARTLLLSLEHSAASLPTKSKKSAMQTDLQQKRDVLKQLNQRLDELTQADIDDDSGGSVDSEDENEDNYPSYAPHRKADAGIEVTSASEQGNQALEHAAHNLASEVRRRAGKGSSEVASATGNSLFSSKPTTTTDTTEATLSHDRSEQEGLTNSLLEMAKQLKQQSIHFGQTLESDTSVLDRTVAALDRSSQGMDAAGQRIGTLRRMTEGRGWWDRMKLYAMIFGLWLAIFLVVLGPKIRF